MSQEIISPEKKGSILKSLAIAGFVGILALVAWLSIQLVHLFPTAITSLASLAEGVNQYPNTIVESDSEPLPLAITSNTSLLSAGEPLTIEWDQVQSNGNYVFAYECADGVSISHDTELGQRSVDCDINYNIGSTDELTIAIDSEKNRYSDVAYSISFVENENESPRALGTNTVTVVNTGVSNQEFAFAPESIEVTTEPTPAVTEVIPEVVIPVVTVPETPEQEVSIPAPAEPTPVTTESTPPAVTPFVDLATTYISAGEIIDGAFVPGPVSVQNAGALQFAVKNMGTKTSDGWIYQADLPTGNIYESPIQQVLLPGERAVITIGFPAGAINPHTFTVYTAEDNDLNSTNDSFSRLITFAE